MSDHLLTPTAASIVPATLYITPGAVTSGSIYFKKIGLQFEAAFTPTAVDSLDNPYLVADNIHLHHHQTRHSLSFK